MNTLARTQVGLLALVAGLPAAANAQPAIIQWAGATSGAWNNPANWSPAQVPTSQEAAAFYGAGESVTVSFTQNAIAAELGIGHEDLTLDLNAARFDLNYLFVGVTPNTSSSLNMGSGLIHAETLCLVGAGDGVNATLQLDGPGETLEASLLLSGTETGVTSTIRVLGGATLHTLETDLGTLPEPGLTSVLVSGPTSRWSNDGRMQFGHYGLVTGNPGDGSHVSLRIENGAQVQCTGTDVWDDRVNVGMNTGNVGDATITGAGSRWTVGGHFWVGGDLDSDGITGGGDGTVLIENGGIVAIQGSASLGTSFDSTGAMTVTGAGSSFSAFGMHVGGVSTNGGQGNLIVRDGATVTASAATLNYGWFYNNNYRSSITLTGTGTTLNLPVTAPGYGYFKLFPGGDLAIGRGATMILGGGFFGAEGGTVPQPPVVTYEIGSTAQKNSAPIRGAYAELGCALRVRLVDGYVPHGGDRFPVITANSFSTRYPTFTSLDLANFPQGLGGVLQYTSTGVVLEITGNAPCYANCDGNTSAPLLTAADFTCFLTKFRTGDPSANCDGNTSTPLLTAADFTCFLNAFRAGCP